MTTNAATATRNARKQQTQRYGQTELDAGMQNAGQRGIVAGSHTEFEKPTTLDKTVAAFMGFGKAWDSAISKFKSGKSTQYTP